jgi:uncharacterized HTH-type transcriptional regulator ybbB
MVPKKNEYTKKRKVYNFMMELKNRPGIVRLAESMRMEMFHFAAGVYPVRPWTATMRPVNRLFLVKTNPDGVENWIEDCNGRCVLESGCAYLIPAFHSTRWILTEHLQFISIHFRLEGNSGVDLFSASKRIFPLRDSGLFREAETAWREPDEYASAAGLKSLCYRLCSGLFRLFSAEERDAVTRYGNFLQVVEFVEKNGNAKTGVAELAELTGMRPDVFSRKFSSETGITPKNFLNRVLIRKAGELLLRRKTARETAFLLGFNNEYYFSRFFKKMTGLSPGNYRKMHEE